LRIVIYSRGLQRGQSPSEVVNIAATQKIKIGVCISNFNDKFTAYLLEGMQNYSKNLNDVELA